MKLGDTVWQVRTNSSRQPYVTTRVFLSQEAGLCLLGIPEKYLVPYSAVQDLEMRVTLVDLKSLYTTLEAATKALGGQS